MLNPPDVERLKELVAREIADDPNIFSDSDQIAHCAASPLKVEVARTRALATAERVILALRNAGALATLEPLSPPEDVEKKLKWHVGDNLRWLADQSDRPDYMPCGMLTGAFLITVASEYERLSTALSSSRADALEEAAKVAEADMRSPMAKDMGYKPDWFKHAERIAAAIRSLISTPQEEA